MIRKLFSLIYKDILLLLRDKAGLSMMFIMPMLLVVLMTKLQDSTFNSINETQIPLALLNLDTDSLGNAIERQLSSSGIFSITRSASTSDDASEKLKASVARGDRMVGIIIPAKATENIRNNIRRYVSTAFNGTVASPVTPDTVHIEIYIDPVVKTSFRSTLMSALREQAARTESEFLSQAIVAEVNRYFPISISGINISPSLVSFSEQYALPTKDAVIPNSTQHNIPAWSLFAVFFISISLSGNIIKEREDGSYLRLLTMPCPEVLYMLSKATVYMLVCLLQYAVIFLMGVFLLPSLGLPAFALQGALPLSLVMAVSSASAAISYGIAIGKLAGTHQQAAIFASISTVIMAALGGIWIPVFVMPPLMKYAAALSPLNWGIEGFYDIFIRGGNLLSILPECAASFIFSALCIIAAPLLHRRKKHRTR
ncbi:MAG: ABC transporter permease [Tannerellaceae bacterium]|jgi:ABC-2 type transport system permease protein|nr:ABC transporter permease [Tannerellaceae bacterium]